MPKTFQLALLLTATAVLAAAGEEPDCVVPPTVRQELMKLDFNAFDQTMGEGWRKYSDMGCKKEAAELIDRYYGVHEAELESWQKRVNRWHAGQVYASMDDYETARIRFLDSYDPDEPAKPDFPWNDYVSATIAFIDGDREKLQKHRDRIAATDDQPNLHVVDNLLKHFGEPYSVAAYGKASSEKD